MLQAVKKTFSILLILLATINLKSQILGLNKPLFSDLPFFNTQFIKNNNIKSITGSISSKKSGDIIRSNGTNYYYQFKTDGRLSNQLSSYFSGGVKDTSTIYYKYNSKGKLSTKRKSDSYGYSSHHYKYDNTNNISTQTYCREENKFNSKSNFELKKEYIIVIDSFSYQRINNEQTKKTFYNSYGKKFKEQINYYDKLGYLTEEYTKFIIGNNKKKLTYKYNENGQLFKKNSYLNIAQNKKTTEIYSYDEIGNVLDIKYFNNDIHKSTKQFLYDKKTLLLSAMIIEDISTQLLQIIKYHYTFYNNFINLTESEKK